MAERPHVPPQMTMTMREWGPFSEVARRRNTTREHLARTAFLQYTEDLAEVFPNYAWFTGDRSQPEVASGELRALLDNLSIHLPRYTPLDPDATKVTMTVPLTDEEIELQQVVAILGATSRNHVLRAAALSETDRAYAPLDASIRHRLHMLPEVASPVRNVSLRLSIEQLEQLIGIALADGDTTIGDQMRIGLEYYICERLRDPRMEDKIRAVQEERKNFLPPVEE